MLFGTACDEWLDVNNNIDAPDYVDDYLYLAGVLSTLQDITFDMRAHAPLAQMWSTTSYTSYATHYNPRGVDDGALIWRTVYFNHGQNLENMKNEAISQEHWTLAGMCYIIKAHGWDMLTKIHGEAPMKQFLNPNLTQFDYDYQDEIYEQIREWALEGIKYLEMDDKTNYYTKLTNNDLVYKGDAEKWKKFGYAVLVRNLVSLTNKTDFVSKYADKLIEYAGKSFQSADDDAMVKGQGGSQNVTYGDLNNFLGTYRGNMGLSYFQHDYAVQLMTGTVPVWDSDGNRIRVILSPEATDEEKAHAEYYCYELAPTQIICDTIITVAGHYDPRAAAKLSTATNPSYNGIGDVNVVKRYRFYGGSAGNTRSNTSLIANVLTPHFYGRTDDVRNVTLAAPNDGLGRYLFYDAAPYVLSTCAEIKFCLAEAYWKKGDKTNAYKAFKEGIAADMDFVQGQLHPGTADSQTGGDKINAAAFRTLANEYLAGPYVDALGESNLTLSHIMMQKWCALWTWGALEAWTDLRKYHYDIAYTGDYPSLGNGWSEDRYINHKAESDVNRIYKGFYLHAARNIQFCKTPFNVLNGGSPMYRIRPRYNSEYVWNKKKMEDIKPISGMADNYHCSIPWFAYPNGYPSN